MSETGPHVLVVEDEPRLLTLYANWLSGSYDTSTARDGDEAIAALDGSVDVVLLDRRMPGTSGDEVVAHADGRGLDCRIAMLTAIEPDFDIVDLGIDDYLLKPVSRDDVEQTVDQLLERRTHDDRLETYLALVSKKVLLDRSTLRAERRASQEYARLERQLATLGDDVGDLARTLLEEGHQLCRDVTRRSILQGP